MVQGNTSSGDVHQTQSSVGTGNPPFGKGFPFTQSSCVITTLVCSKSLLEFSTTHPRTSKKYGNRQADCGEGAFHQEIYSDYLLSNKSRRTLSFCTSHHISLGSQLETLV